MCSHPHRLVVKHDEAACRATVVSPAGRLPKSMIDDLCGYLAGASTVGRIARRPGRLTLTHLPGASQNIDDLVALRERHLAERDRRETDKSRTLERRMGRQQKVFLADAGHYVDNTDVLRLLDEQAGVRLSREIPELNDPTPRFELPEPIRQLELQLAA